MRASAADIRRIFIGLLILLSALALGAGAPADAQQRTFKRIKVFLDKAGQLRPGDSSIQGVADIFDETYIYLDLRIDRASIAENQKESFLLLYSTEQANERTPVDCAPDRIGRLEMLDDIEYYIETKHQGALVQASIFPGARTVYPFNDVFCGKSGSAQGLAEMRLRGYFFVIRNDIENGVDIQLRPLELNNDEARQLPLDYGRER